MKSLRLTRREIHVSYRIQLLPKILYHMVALVVTEEQLKKVEQRAMMKITHLHELPVTAANEKMYFPRKYGGYGVINLQTEI